MGGGRWGHEVFTHNGLRNRPSRHQSGGCGDCSTLVVYTYQRRCRFRARARGTGRTAGPREEEHRSMRRSLPQSGSRLKASLAALGWSLRSSDGLHDWFMMGTGSMLQVAEHVRGGLNRADGGRRGGPPDNAAACRGAFGRRGSANALWIPCSIGAFTIGTGKSVCAPAECVTLPIRPIHRSFTWADEVTDATCCAVWTLWLAHPSRCPPGTRMGHQLRRNWHMMSMAASH